MTCSVQAYRCPKIPDVMSETIPLIYTIFITSVSFAVSFPISYFRRQYTDKEFLSVVILILNCYVTLVLMYGKKCYLIVWQPSKNTKEYFNQKRMKYTEERLTNPEVPLTNNTDTLKVTAHSRAGKDNIIISENTTDLPFD